MNLEEKLVDGILVLKLANRRLDASVAAAFKEQVVGLINQGHKIIVLDLESVDFIDSSGLGAMVSCLKLVGVKGRIALCHLAGPVLSMLQLTRMDKVFVIHPTTEQALEALRT
ncbi:STAS domain-containing protein [Methylomagnum sp.]